MAAVEIILLVCGMICIVVSFLFNFGDQVNAGEPVTAELTSLQKEKLKEEIDQIIQEELENLNEKTEASLDKISNTKILEMNDYAENILGQINKNHNETVFLYDMLNEKAKEVKNAVRDVNEARKELERIRLQSIGISDDTAQADVEPENVAQMTATGSKNQVEAAPEQSEKPEVRDAARERLAELVQQSNEKSRHSSAAKNHQAQQLDRIVSESSPSKKTAARKKAVKQEILEVQLIPEEAATMNIQFEKGANNNDKILKLFSMGVSNKDIAKQLNLGVGEVKLVIDLYNGGK